MQKGDLFSEFLIGIFYFEGKGCPSNIDKAVYHLKHAAAHGVYEAQDLLDIIKQQQANKTQVQDA